MWFTVVCALHLRAQIFIRAARARGRQGRQGGRQAMSPTPAELWDVWRRTPYDRGVLLFYGHHACADEPWFSNFYEHSPFAFAIPPWCGMYGKQETVPIEFSEKAIMLCKASLMGDKETFASVAAAQTPAEAKRLGRLVEPWDEDRWQLHVCHIARHVAIAKFEGVPGLRERLLATGERLIAEAAPNDRVWGIGLGRKDPHARCPWKWKGSNVLGWALMQARERLRIHAVEAPLACSASDQHGRRFFVTDEQPRTWDSFTQTEHGPDDETTMMERPRVGNNAQGSLAQAAHCVKSFEGDVVVLVTHGSFNPVHADHLQMMLHARDVVHEQHPVAMSEDARKNRHRRQLLVLGVFGICSQDLLQRKVLKPEDRYSDDTRVQMLKLATAAHDWLFVADASLSTKAPSAKALIKMLQAQKVLPVETQGKKKVRFIRVTGSDVTRRDGTTANTREALVVDRDESNGHSSAQVREALRQRNGEYLERALPQAVREHILSATHAPYRENHAED